MQNVDPKEAHGHCMISIFMVKICDESICKNWEFIFYECINIDFFLFEGEKNANIGAVQ